MGESRRLRPFLAPFPASLPHFEGPFYGPSRERARAALQNGAAPRADTGRTVLRGASVLRHCTPFQAILRDFT